MSNKKAFISDWITEQEVGTWIPGDIIMIVANTGRGKSYFIKNVLRKHLQEKGLNCLYLLSRLRTKEQFESELPDDDTIRFMTYQAVESIKSNPFAGFSGWDVIIADECHYFLDDSSFNSFTDVSLDWILEQHKAIRVLMTATGDGIEGYLNEQRIMYTQYRIDGDKLWNAGGEDDTDTDTPMAFRQRSKLSQHISFLKDVFRSYKDFSDRHIDTIELMLERLYARWGLNDWTDFSALEAKDYPTVSDLYDVMEDAYQNYSNEKDFLYPAELLQELLLGLHSMCKGAESKFFNGHTNITSSRFLVFGVRDLIQTSGSLCNAMLLNVFSYFSNKLLVEGNTVAALDELHVWITNKIAISYIRNVLKRARKRDSSLILASQNLEDFMLPGVAELTRPLFAIPTHQFLFNAGNVDKSFYMNHLQLEESEFELIRYPRQTVCLYKCGNERYLLKVIAPEYKSELFGTAGGK